MSLYGIISNVRMHYEDNDSDIPIGIKQLSDYLLSANKISYDNKINYTSDQDYTIEYDNHRLVKTPGYEILISNIDSINIYEENKYLYITIARDSKQHTYLIGELYEKALLPE